jgi:hypothetical protein
MPERSAVTMILLDVQMAPKAAVVEALCRLGVREPYALCPMFVQC